MASSANRISRRMDTARAEESRPRASMMPVRASDSTNLVIAPAEQSPLMIKSGRTQRRSRGSSRVVAESAITWSRMASTDSAGKSRLRGPDTATTAGAAGLKRQRSPAMVLGEGLTQVTLGATATAPPLGVEALRVLGGVDLHGVAARSHVARLQARSLARDVMRELPFCRKVVVAGQVIGDPAGLLVGDRHDGAERLGQTDEEEAAVSGVEHAAEERQIVVVGADVIGSEERKGHPIAGTIDDGIRFHLVTVVEFDALTTEAPDGRAHLDRPALHEGRQFVGEGWVGLANQVVGFGQPEVAHAPANLAKGPGCNAATQAVWQPPGQ